MTTTAAAAAVLAAALPGLVAPSLALAAACNFTEALPSNILPGYAKGYSPTHQPYANTLEAAEAWCCKQGPKICGGVTFQAGKYDARAGCEPRHCSTGFDCTNVSSWVRLRGPQDPPCTSPSPPGPPPHGPHGPPPVDIPVWPVPNSVVLGPPATAPVAVSPSFVVAVPASAPPALQAAAARYQAIIRKSALSSGVPPPAAAEAVGALLSRAVVDMTGKGSAGLTFETDYSYSLKLPTTGAAAAATVTAATEYGAMYGLETLAQLCANGTLAAAGAAIDDRPRYRYRGLMLDTGRRFIPVPDVLNSLSAMAATKMNVLHLHL
jgi:hypothetical protein